MTQTTPSTLRSYASPAAEVAERMASHYGETATTFTVVPEEWVGTQEVEKFLQQVEDAKDSSRDALIFFR
jgi:hypothetical protein